MHRGACQATVNGVTKSDTAATKHSTVIFQNCVICRNPPQLQNSRKSHHPKRKGMFVEAPLDLFWGFIATRSQIGAERWYNCEDKMMGPHRSSNKRNKSKQLTLRPFSKDVNK